MVRNNPWWKEYFSDGYLVTFIALFLLDIITTVLVIANGGYEANRLMRIFTDLGFPIFAFVKIVMLVGISVIYHEMKHNYPELMKGVIIASILFYAGLVVINTFSLFTLIF